MLNRREEEGRARHPLACTCTSCAAVRLAREQEERARELGEFSRPALPAYSPSQGHTNNAPGKTKGRSLLMIVMFALAIAGLIGAIVWKANS